MSEVVSRGHDLYLIINQLDETGKKKKKIPLSAKVRKNPTAKKKKLKRKLAAGDDPSFS